MTVATHRATNSNAIHQMRHTSPKQHIAAATPMTIPQAVFFGSSNVAVMVGRPVGAPGPLAPVEGVAVPDMGDGREVPLRRRGGNGPFQTASVPRVAHGHRISMAVTDGHGRAGRTTWPGP